MDGQTDGWIDGQIWKYIWGGKHDTDKNFDSKPISAIHNAKVKDNVKDI